MLKGLNPGRLDLRVTIEQSTITTNSINEQVITWSEYKKCFASKDRKPSDERMEAKQAISSDNTEYIIRYDSGILATMRLKESDESTYYYFTDVRQWRREGYTQINGERRDNQ